MSPVNNNNMFFAAQNITKTKKKNFFLQRSADKKITSLFVSAVVSKSEKQFDDIICTRVSYVPLQQHCTVTEIKKDNVFWKESGP